MTPSLVSYVRASSPAWGDFSVLTLARWRTDSLLGWLRGLSTDRVELQHIYVVREEQ